MIRFILAFLALAGAASGATYTAATATLADVTTAYNLTSNGDTLVIPAGDENWASGLTVTKLITIKGTNYNDNGTPDLMTDDTWGTTIRPNMSSGNRRAFFFNGSGTQRLQEIAMTPGASSTGSQQAELGNVVSDVSSVFIMERCKATNPDSTVCVPYGYGGMFSCWVILNTNVRAVVGQNGSVAGGSNGDSAWTDAIRWGTSNFFFMEDNYINRTDSSGYGALDGWTGMRVCVRYNDLLGTRLGNHGTETAQRYRSGRAMEVYRNNFNNTQNAPVDNYVDVRGGTLLFHNNVMTGLDKPDVKLNNYRLSTLTKPWFAADGTMAWDGADTSDTFGTAGDGIFETGTATTTGASSVTDSSKSWDDTGDGEWAGYVVRAVFPFTCTGSPSAGVISVGAGGLTASGYTNGVVTNKTTGQKGVILSNTTNQITLDSGWNRPTFTNGDLCEISLSAEIESNTATTLSLGGGADSPTYSWPVAWRGCVDFEIRKVSYVLDGPGRGQTSAITGSPAPPQNLGSNVDPIYVWNNTGTIDISNTSATTIQINRDYYTSALSGYTEYTYPHPLRTNVAPDTTAPTLDSAAINSDTLTLVFSESVEDVVAAAWTISGRTVSAAIGSGTTWTMTVSDAAEYGDTITVNYTPGIVVDTSSNALASISSRAVTNNTPDPGDPSVRNVGRKAKAGRMLNR